MNELSKNELMEIDGGNWVAIALGAIAVYDAISDAFAGFNEGFASARK